MRSEDDRVALAYWNGFSGAWRIPPPLAPAPDDIRWFESHVTMAEAGDGRGRDAFLLGVTPTIAELLHWPQAHIVWSRMPRAHGPALRDAFKLPLDIARSKCFPWLTMRIR